MRNYGDNNISMTDNYTFPFVSNKAVQEARARQDPLAYYKACNALGLSLENVPDQELYFQGIVAKSEESLIEMPEEQLTETLEQRVDKKLDKYREFVDAVIKKGVRANDLFADPNIKAELLEEYCGYSKLKVRGGRERTRDCDTRVIGHAFQERYLRAIAYISQHEEHNYSK